MPDPYFDHGQKAPSAKRCIKTNIIPFCSKNQMLSQKAPSAKRCIKTFITVLLAREDLVMSEGTERQKVH